MLAKEPEEGTPDKPGAGWRVPTLQENTAPYNPSGEQKPQVSGVVMDMALVRSVHESVPAKTVGGSTARIAGDPQKAPNPFFNKRCSSIVPILNMNSNSACNNAKSSSELQGGTAPFSVTSIAKTMNSLRMVAYPRQFLLQDRKPWTGCKTSLRLLKPGI